MPRRENWSGSGPSTAASIASFVKKTNHFSVSRGTDHPRNLALACHHCNDHKGPNLSGIDPKTGKVVRLFNPRRQRWHRHFRFVGACVIGRTPCGRGTIAVLAMNHPDRVRLREALVAAGLFDEL